MKFNMKFLISLVILTFSLIQSLRLSNNKYMKIRIQTLLKSTISSAKASESGASMQIENANLSIGNNDIISGINWTIMPKERWALVGKNGAGKSTLLKALTGSGGENVMIRNGSISVAKKARVGYLEQKGVSGSTKSVRDEVASRMDRLQAATKALEVAEAKVVAGDTSDEALTALELSTTEFELAGGYTIEQKISNVLRGLGFVEEDYDRLCSEFSGGWQMRIALARLLLSEPDLLFLDEPSNHLDKGAREWLGNYLSVYDGTLLIVSHDSELLEAAANSIAEVRGGKIELYKSRSHQQWLIERDERVKLAQAQFEANQREIDRLQGFVDRFGAKTMGASLAQSKLKTIEKLSTNGPEAPMISDGPKAVLKLPNPPRGSKKLLELKNVKLAWTEKDPTGTDSTITTSSTSNEKNVPFIPTTPVSFIIKECNIRIERGMRIAVRGPNGAGKSTLLSALAGKLLPAAGDRIEGEDLALGVFTQDLAQDLPQDISAVDVVTASVREYDPTLSDERARSVLGALGLTGEKSLRLVGHLSGGEKARVALASFVLIPHNLLLLDEPSNHLDVGTIEVLTNALRSFTGSCLVISHDKPFLEALDPTHVITVKDGIVTMEERSLTPDDWIVPLQSRTNCDEKESKFNNNIAILNTNNSNNKQIKDKSSSTKTITNVITKPAMVDINTLNDNDRKKILNAPRRIKKIENLLEKHDIEIKEIEQSMLDHGKNRSKLMELQKSKDDIQLKIDKLYIEYEELSVYI